MKTYIKITLLTSLVMMSFACEGFLDERPNKKILIPTTIDDIRAMLDNSSEMNIVPAFGQLGSDDLVISDAGWASLSTTSEQNAYIFAEEIFQGSASADWEYMYRQIFVANVALEQLQEFMPSTAKKELNGEALFHRAHAHFMLAQLFATPYLANTVSTDLAIPLRLNSNVQETTPRSTMMPFYSQVLMDLKEAFEGLPEYSAIKTRPSKVAAKALESRVYLTMGEFEKAELAADYALASSYYELLDYNLLDPESAYPFATYNSEVIFHTSLISHSFLDDWNSEVWINPELEALYSDDDLRSVLYSIQRSNGAISFKGQYTGDYSRFGGLALDEVYFIKAECLARRGQLEEAVNFMDLILTTRFKYGTYVGYENRMPVDLLAEILQEKRKSLLFRGINWIDLRRLNFGDSYGRVINRTVDGQKYTLSPKSNKFNYPIPDSEINLNPVPNNDRR
ncbi:RagB/SusD family nutrient uptake outer membrane protein [Algoriphagus aquimarinus]|uniref:RagB/SusD family nutrient uptake outer membrane protein n=1 Tax=Algoriphagus aquimarinus TaxID=237018 RepID=A0A5C7A7N5_9BACT|nr:RagB/SusD family nutrient uptake outer membrane protein [Algoriphagus aquimarinus]TXE01854.1 RagB/SusD family nutrient uptake outer membrane protein [Algoriphagus aquimarinus]